MPGAFYNSDSWPEGRKAGCLKYYHLLIETTNADLGRVMRHINGVYTQRYNRITKVDGALFRGRYKAILVEQ